MTNPFENPEGEFKALTNDEDQHSLWPAFLDVPNGWRCAFGPASRADCLSFIEKNWLDMRPKSLMQPL